MDRFAGTSIPLLGLTRISDPKREAPTVAFLVAYRAISRKTSDGLPIAWRAAMRVDRPAVTIYLMTTIREFCCEICGTVSTNPIHWFVIQCGNQNLTVIKWNNEAANAPGARHYCGESHAQVYISRWFESVCSSPKPDFLRSSHTQ